MSLASFTRAYIDAALWSSTDDDGEPLDKEYGGSDIVSDTKARMERDCASFYEKYGNLLPKDDQGGHDFWLTRNHHGAGFWDGDYEEPDATTLTNAAHAYGEFDLYVGDDGEIHGSGGREQNPILRFRPTLKAIHAMGMEATYDQDVDEYRVNIPGGTEATAYYTPDADDAIGTAKAMKEHRAQHGGKRNPVQNGRSYAVRGVPPKRYWEPTAGETVYVEGTPAKIKRVYTDEDGTPYVDFVRPVRGTTGMSVANLRMVARVENPLTRGDYQRPEAAELRAFILDSPHASRTRRWLYQLLLNYDKKKAKGTYNHELAIKGFLPVVTEGAKGYMKEYGQDVVFTTGTRNAVAQELVFMYEDGGLDAIFEGKDVQGLASRNPGPPAYSPAGQARALGIERFLQAEASLSGTGAGGAHKMPDGTVVSRMGPDSIRIHKPGHLGGQIYLGRNGVFDATGNEKWLKKYSPTQKVTRA